MRVKEVKGIGELPENELLEELRIYYKPLGKELRTDQRGKRQEVLLFGKRIGDDLFSTDEKGETLDKFQYEKIEWITFIERSF